VLEKTSGKSRCNPGLGSGGGNALLNGDLPFVADEMDHAIDAMNGSGIILQAEYRPQRHRAGRRGLPSHLRTDAALNPGNLRGPLRYSCAAPSVWMLVGA
jgi:hypothetical protein